MNSSGKYGEGKQLQQAGILNNLTLASLHYRKHRIRNSLKQTGMLKVRLILIKAINRAREEKGLENLTE